MDITAANMINLLGPDADDQDAEYFADYLTSHGWELFEREDGQINACRNGEVMTEEEWAEALEGAFG